MRWVLVLLASTLFAGEYAGATPFDGAWISTFSPVADPQDLALKGYVKHDGKRLYFAFDITGDVLYGIDIPHDLTREGFPWFGDEMELLINATANGQSWQMVRTKSRLGGIGKDGLLEGEPRGEQTAWNNYQHWITTHAMDCAANPKPGGKGYIIEWAVNFDPSFEVSPGVFYDTKMGDRAMGFSIAHGTRNQVPLARVHL